MNHGSQEVSERRPSGRLWNQEHPQTKGAHHDGPLLLANWGFLISGLGYILNVAYMLHQLHMFLELLRGQF